VVLAEAVSDFIRLTGGSGLEEYFGKESRPFYERLLG
jgi:hypothetical protein